MITIQSLKAERVFSVDVLRTVKNGKAFYFIKLEDSKKFIRISKKTYLEIDLLLSYSSNLMTRIEGKTVRHFKTLSVI